nr:MAG TPA: hypothetical protein [Caudoviricetes sp.]
MQTQDFMCFPCILVLSHISTRENKRFISTLE